MAGQETQETHEARLAALMRSAQGGDADAYAALM
jgi:hypothetical protein